MKQLLPFTFFTIFVLTSCNKKVEKTEENKDQFVTSCINESKRLYSGTFKDEDIKVYCSCSADKAMDNFTTTELVKLNLPGQYPELQEKLMKIIQPCIDDLSKKVQ